MTDKTAGKTPSMLNQYRQIKARYPDAVVLFRLGDFYEMFEDDARLGARELGLVLTWRSFGKGIRLPMAGVPHSQVTNAIAKLIDRGHKVAVAEQLEDSRRVKRLVKRDVVRVVTPGTVVEDVLLREKAENYLAVISVHPQVRSGFGLAMVDVSTGEFVTAQVDGPEGLTLLLEELARAAPSELVLPADLTPEGEWMSALRTLHLARISLLDRTHFEPEIARQRLLDHFGVVSLDAYGCEGMPLAVSAAGVALQYLAQNQAELAHVRSLRTYSLTDYMLLDATTRRNLELTEPLHEPPGSRAERSSGTLFAILDWTHTAMGARLLRRWLSQPLLDLQTIHERQDAVEELVGNGLLRHDLRALLDGLYDVQRLVGRIGFGHANARDLVALRRSLVRLPQVKALLKDVTSARLQRLQADLEELQDVAELIGRAIVDHPPILLREGGLIQAGYHGELDHLRQAAAQGRKGLAELEARERGRTGLKSLRIRYNEVFGFFLEVPRSQAHLVPPEYERKATISHAERFISPELKLLEAEILSAEERINDLEYDLFVDVRQQVAVQAQRIQNAARILAELDALASLAEVAARYSFAKPVVDDSDVIHIREGRHPTVERLLPEGERFVPNEAHLDGDERLIILTGPNLSGKSVYIRQVALITLLAQMGSFVPAASARIGRVDRIFCRAGASDDITHGRSTFLVEMSETAHILSHATPRSLVILDEVGRGTSTYDGLSLAWAVAEHIHDVVGAKTLFATHFHELTRLTETCPRARTYRMAVKEQGREVIFLRRVVPGGADRSYGVQVARLAGLPDRVVNRAREVLARLEDEAPAAAKKELIIPEELRDLAERKGLEGIEVRDETVLEVLQELFGLDIANMTPIQALIALNSLQGRLRAIHQPSSPAS